MKSSQKPSPIRRIAWRRPSQWLKSPRTLTRRAFGPRPRTTSRRPRPPRARARRGRGRAPSAAPRPGGGDRCPRASAASSTGRAPPRSCRPRSAARSWYREASVRGVGHAGEARLEEARGVDALHRLPPEPGVARDHRDLGGVRPKDADHQVVLVFVRAEHVVRIRMLDCRDEIEFSLFQHVGVRVQRLHSPTSCRESARDADQAHPAHRRAPAAPVPLGAIHGVLTICPQRNSGCRWAGSTASTPMIVGIHRGNSANAHLLYLLGKGRVPASSSEPRRRSGKRRGLDRRRDRTWVRW